MRRTGVRVSVYWNFIIHQIFPEFLQPLWDLRIQRVARSIVVFFLFGFWNLLAWVPPGCLTITNQFRHLHWRDVTVNPIFPFSNLNFTYCR